MINSLLKRPRKFRVSSNHAKIGGFTLLELLVAMLVGGLISAGLLFIVVQLIQTNLREAARSDTQRDLQAAIDYIARDVREAVYVYDADCLLDRPTGTNASRCPGLRNYLPSSVTESTNNIPVLAFWRLDPLPGQVDPPTKLQGLCFNQAAAYSQSGPLPTQIQGVPCLSGQMYTLVVYSLNNAAGAISRGRARIMRYELPQFTSSSIPDSPTTRPDATTGWVSPRGRTTLTSGGTSSERETTFLTWPVDKTTLGGSSLVSLQSQRPTGQGVPLTDFVDWVGLYNPGDSSGRGRAPTIPGLVLTPANGSSAANDPPRGFYVYVRGGEREGDINQEVIIRIQGDAAGRPGIPRPTSLNRPVVPIALETRVLIRGVTNKTQ